MTQPDYREKAVNIAAKIVSDAIEKGERPAQSVERLAQAIADAHLAGRREGIEASAKVAERMYGPYWSKGYRTASVVIARDIRALLEGGK